MPPRPVRLQDLNPAQRDAVRQVDGSVLILAGAGTGKTRVITTRICYMLATGIDPSEILAVTFTNKAANEMRERVGQMVTKKEAKAVTICTFHSLCVRILKRGIEKLGYKKNFTIYTSSDQIGLIRKIIVRRAGKDEKLEPGLAQSLISRAKNRGVPVSDNSDALASVVYHEYQQSLKTLNAVDFDDLLGLATRILADYPEERDYWCEHFAYIMVDEFQDTNKTQMDLLRHLGSRHKNVCVVGDDDQSIYGWRGAEISNILDFERFFPGPKVIKLEENYRSTQPVLETANSLIRHNQNRREKRLWSSSQGKEKVRLIPMPGDREEAEIVCSEIWEEQRASGCPWEDFAVLFRTNMQSRPLEEALRNLKIPYRLIGGQSFFERREVKDIIAYLKILQNPDDDVNLLRIINTPARGISNGTVAAATEHSIGTGTSIHRALGDPVFQSLLGTRARGAVTVFLDLIGVYSDAIAQPAADLGPLTDRLLGEIAYVPAMKRSCKTEEEMAAREQNIFDLQQALHQHTADKKGGLGEFLESIALDDAREDQNEDLEKKKGVSLITLHAAKGLEFPAVYLVGLEEGILPHKRSLDEGTRDEERRLLYVGITRARERLSLTYCNTRTRWGDKQPCLPSSFLKELDREHLDEVAYDEMVNEPATDEAAKGYFGMMKEMLGKGDE